MDDEAVGRHPQKSSTPASQHRQQGQWRWTVIVEEQGQFRLRKGAASSV